jgi:hypothetical protein
MPCLENKIGFIVYSKEVRTNGQLLANKDGKRGGCDMTNGALNPIVEENLKVGNSYEEWGIDGIGALENQGFATDISVNHGETVHFKIKTNATQYRLEIYRLGYYLNGEGARRIDTVGVGPLPQPVPQSPDQIDPATGLLSCSLWSESTSWSVPGDAVSGIYFAKVIREVIGGIPQAIDQGQAIYFLWFATTSVTLIYFSKRPMPPGRHTMDMAGAVSTAATRPQ